MPTYSIGIDSETAERAGAGGMYQVDTVFDENENDITNRIDVGTFFRDEDEFKDYLSKQINVPVDEIDIVYL
ncbi:MAG: hypothetical protein ACSHW7_02310 [Patiriisocius sp.]|uniref:hypothetical protein n=1 Tax=Patiriisocius sp. TaxID=2822396 RepID=UPI003EF40308